MKRIIVGVMGPGEATDQELANAHELGRHIAKNGWILLSGGMNKGVMDAVNRGAKAENGLTVGIISSKSKEDASEAVDVPIVTGMGSGRNYINVLSSDILIACGMGAGTASEVAMAIKDKKPVVLLTDSQKANEFFKSLSPEMVFVVSTTEEAIEKAKSIVG